MKCFRFCRPVLLFCLIAILMFAPLLSQWSALASASQQAAKPRYAKNRGQALQKSPNDAGIFILRRNGNEVACDEATPLEAQALSGRDANVQLHVLADEAVLPQAADGLTVTLRGTQQLENNPLAKAAFMRAAATWSGLIKSPITIIIDVDFGTTFFGEDFDEDVLGATDTQQVGAANLYADLRQGFLDFATSAAETTLYNSLPQGSVPTDSGNATGVSAPTAVFRALDFLDANADPASETADLGDPPAIGFNSGFDFDFDPSDGIDADRIDFEGIALHEIGHALGFASSVGSRELHPTDPLRVSTWDIFRFRPGIASGNFATTQRVLASGGSQVFFAGGEELPVSTGRPDGTGGDGEQSSHWKDDRFGGGYLGVMDPTARDGQRLTITQNDLEALEFLGHAVAAAPPPSGDTIVLTSGTPATGNIVAPAEDSCVLHGIQFSIQVPAGSAELKIDLTGMPDIDLYARFNNRISIAGGAAVADFESLGLDGNESITISPTTTPSLQAGTYFIALGNCGAGAGTFNLTATVTAGSGDAGSPPVINTLAARLDGDSLNLTGTATDADGNISRALVSVLNDAGTELAASQEIPVDFGTTQSVNVALTLNGLNQTFVLSGVQARLVLIDTQGNRSAASTANFTQADSGGATLGKVSFNPDSGMTFKGSGFATPTEVEINGVIVTPPLNAKVKGSSGKKIKLTGTLAQLGLRTGVNRVRVRRNNVYSNLKLFTL